MGKRVVVVAVAWLASTLACFGACTLTFHNVGSGTANIAIYSPNTSGTLVTSQTILAGNTWTSPDLTGWPSLVFTLGGCSGSTGVSCGLAVDVNAGTCTNNAPGPTYSSSGCITNNSASPQGYWIHTSVPVQQCSGMNPPATDFYSGVLAPGQFACLCLSNSSPFQMTPIQVTYNPDGGTNGQVIGPPGWAGTNGTTTVGNTGTGNPGNGPGNNPGSGDGSGNGTNVTGNQYAAGISNLINVVYSGDQTIAADLGNILGQLKTMGTNGGSSSSSSGGTNVNVVGSPYSTNAPNFGSYSGGTNQTLATGLGALGSAGTQLEAVTNAIGLVPTIGAGNNAALSFAFCGYTLNLDPESVMPGWPSVIRQMIGWGAAIGFGLWFGNRLWELSQTYAQAETGGVPDMDGELLGFGGNVVGVAVALLVPVVLVAIWIAILTVACSYGLSIIGGTVWSTNPFSSLTGSSGQAALYLMNDLLPLPFLMSLAWTRLACVFGMSLLVAAGATASKFLFGK